MTTTMLWRRLDQPGHDAARLVERADSALLQGTAVFVEGGRPCRLDYRVECDATWRTVAARVVGWLDDVAIDVTLATKRRPRVEPRRPAVPDVAGCDDVDLSFTPATTCWRFAGRARRSASASRCGRHGSTSR